MNDANKFSVVIFVDLAAEKEERLLQQVKSLDSNSFENIVDKKFKLHVYLFFVSDFNKNYKKISKIWFFVFSFHKIQKVKIKKMVQADLYFVKLKKINFDIWPD